MKQPLLPCCPDVYSTCARQLTIRERNSAPHRRTNHSSLKTRVDGNGEGENTTIQRPTRATTAPTSPATAPNDGQANAVRTQPGSEPGTTRTLSEYYAREPLGRWESSFLLPYTHNHVANYLLPRSATQHRSRQSNSSAEIYHQLFIVRHLSPPSPNHASPPSSANTNHIKYTSFSNEFACLPSHHCPSFPSIDPLINVQQAVHLSTQRPISLLPLVPTYLPTD